MFINHINHQNPYINHKNVDTNKNLIIDINVNKKTKTKDGYFLDCVKKTLKKISENQNRAKKNTEKFMSNNPEINLHDMIIDLQKSSIVLEMAIQIRNKVIAAYQDVINQQI
ncbi:flagellar hook-basal body complex protein FliE [Buchnera aphidicola]|uniref:Flagellar hook-basal body complex protein FliE n=1 Tax=Buchnera aphidicola (Artemisaphis artemisicola) TaxID=1241836 RepID=A0A4D6XE79_9GAMM|nr:flagellar hook-basal body complex protein FliE [Buchnera aphidicola]QCI15766.1 flagellar hook-basal body complex protein FliE [Buchnera aphidicola (Artemisaphis artemisicola)]